MITNETKFRLIGHEKVNGIIRDINETKTLKELDLSYGERSILIKRITEGKNTIFRWERSTVSISLATT